MKTFEECAIEYFKVTQSLDINDPNNPLTPDLNGIVDDIRASSKFELMKFLAQKDWALFLQYGLNPQIGVSICLSWFAIGIYMGMKMNSLEDMTE